ncbi:MAG TPA: DUF3426 domain-containing protein [Marinagarivorans sp.]
MTSLITRCPKCSTAFNVTEAHLNTANGAVRCGSCLNVFNGRENLTNSLKKKALSSTLLDDDDDLLISDDLELDEHRYQDREQDQTAERVKSILEKAEDKSVTEVDDDESWALKLLEEEGHNPSLLGLNKKEPETAKPEPPQKAQPQSTKANPRNKVAPSAKVKVKSDGADKARKVVKPAPKPSSPKRSQHSQPDKNTEQDAAVPRSSFLDESSSPVEAETADKTSSVADHNAQQAQHEKDVERGINEKTPAAKKAQQYAASKANEPEPATEINEKDFAELQKELDAAKSDAPPQAPRTLVDAIEVEAVELQYSAKRPVWLSRMIWLLLALLAGAALVGQIAWLKFDELSIKEPYRQYYAMACEHLGCELPIRKNLREIRTSNLMVRSHPNTEGALLVDVVIQNHAHYEQPFPKLVLIFSNIKNKVVASRSFEPSEYLGGDLVGATMMPSLKAIHLSLELVDPGKGAVSYKVVIEE